MTRYSVFDRNGARWSLDSCASIETAECVAQMLNAAAARAVSSPTDLEQIVELEELRAHAPFYAAAVDWRFLEET